VPDAPPLFSVIMPAFRRAALIGRSIETVRAQTFPRWELVVVDDGSDDGTGEVVAALAATDARIRLLRQENRGPAAARNRGVAEARAPWIAYLDSDDIWFPGTLAAFDAAIGHSPGAPLLYGWRHRLSDERVEEVPPEAQERPAGAADLLRGMCLHLVALCHTRAAIERVGGFDEALPACEDLDLLLRLSLAGTSFRPIGVACGAKRRHEGNLSRPSGAGRVLTARVLERFLASGGAALVPPEEAARRLGDLYGDAARAYVRERRFDAALEALEAGRMYGLPARARLAGAAARVLRPFGRRDPRAFPGPLPALGRERAGGS
jgi:glycosyltransferase involved in cell wall biosynthesis